MSTERSRSMDCYYQGKKVELVPNQQYTTHWNFYWNEDDRRVIRSGQPGVDLHFNQVASVSVKEEEAGEDKSEPVSPVVIGTLKINEASFTDVRRVLPGIGRIAAKAIATNRPKEGYRDFDHLLELNKTQLQEVNLNWEEIKSKLEF